MTEVCAICGAIAGGLLLALGAAVDKLRGLS